MQHQQHSIEVRDALPPRQGKRYGPAPQRLDRGCERSARRTAVLLRRGARRLGYATNQVALAVGIPQRTLSEWEQRWREDHLEARARGRPAHPSDIDKRNTLIDAVRHAGPHVGVATYQSQFPDMPRREVQDIVRRYKRLAGLRCRIAMNRLRWTTPGTVWAMDHTQPPALIDGVYRSVLCVRDLASGCQLAWHPLITESARHTIEVLETLFIRHGAPQVIKSDNGSPFIAEPMIDLLRSWSVTRLLSPPSTPRYNGACEAGIGWMKARTDHFATLHGHEPLWTTPDMHAALEQQNHRCFPSGPNGPTPHELFEARTPTTPRQRDDFVAAVDAARGTTITDQEQQQHGRPPQRQHTRSDVERALVEARLLTITRRRIPQPLKSFFMAKITHGPQDAWVHK